MTEQEPSPLRQDLARYRCYGKLQWFEPSLWVVITYRFGQWIERRRSLVVRNLLLMMYFPIHVFVTLATGIQISRHTQIGGGLRIWHFGCIFLNPGVRVGNNCTLRHGVTIGNRCFENDVPTLGNNIDIGAGAKLLGSITIGNNVSIGANAVVITDVPEDHIAVGIPARMRPKRRRAEERSANEED